MSENLHSAVLYMYQDQEDVDNVESDVTSSATSDRQLSRVVFIINLSHVIIIIIIINVIIIIVVVVGVVS